MICLRVTHEWHEKFVQKFAYHMRVNVKFELSCTVSRSIVIWYSSGLWHDSDVTGSIKCSTCGGHRGWTCEVTSELNLLPSVVHRAAVG